MKAGTLVNLVSAVAVVAIAAASSLVMTAVFCNIAACARDPARSWAAKRRSNPMETLIACISSAGLSEKRPPHMACPEGAAFSGASEEPLVI